MSNNNNNVLHYYAYQPGNGRSGEAGVILEPMFEKQLTPSDVGKLNRLVIPKQHAERFFPLSSSSSCMSSSPSSDHNSSSDQVDGANGTLLGFEDEMGKSWRFRYSYWSSSQSYVLTKGWSRYVKEKGLESGDVVFFSRRGLGTLNDGEERFFIGWRRRVGSEEGRHGLAAAARGWTGSGSSSSSGRAHDMMRTYPEQYGHGPILPYGDQNHNYIHPDSVGGLDPNHDHGYSQATNSSRKVRLFGVNLECYLPNDDVFDDVS